MSQPKSIIPPAAQMQPMPSHQCLVRKKPSPLSAKKWSTIESKLQNRWLVTRGNHVDYYAHPKPAKAKPKGFFDLRSVTTLRPARDTDPTAPEFAIEVIASRHHIVLDFEFRAQLDACLQIWMSAAPPGAMPEVWRQKAKATPMRKHMESISQPVEPTRVEDEDENDHGQAGRSSHGSGSSPPGVRDARGGTNGAASSGAAGAPPMLSSSAAGGAKPSPNALSGKRRVLVLGSSGPLGTATLDHLSSAHGVACEVRAGTRNPGSLPSRPGVSAVEATIHEPRESWLKGLDALVIMTPNNEQRVPATIRTATAAAKAQVGHIVVVSNSTADVDNLFGRQYMQIESAVKEACASHRVHYSLIRMPLFLENYLGFTDSIREDAVIRCCIDPAAMYTPTGADDLGQAIANVAADASGRYLDRTLNLAGEAHSLSQVAEWLSEACDAQIRYERIASEVERSSLLHRGLPQVHALSIFPRTPPPYTHTHTPRTSPSSHAHCSLSLLPTALIPVASGRHLRAIQPRLLRTVQVW